MKKIAFIIVWYGEFRSYFPLWLKSCENNPTVDFLLFTDQEQEITLPANVKRYIFSFDALRQKFAKHFDFPIRLKYPYKVCDYRPTYGEVFAEYLTDYDFWGYCDVDLIWGDIRSFITNRILEENERIFTHGHCSLFLNTKEVNAYYRTLSANGHLDYREIYQSDDSWSFDEWAGHRGGGISVIFKEHGIATYDEPVMADLKANYAGFFVNGREDLQKVNCFEYQNGKLYAIGMRNGESYREEVLYCHFQKRKLTLQNHDSWEHLRLVPPGKLQNWEEPQKNWRIWLDVISLDFWRLLKRFWMRLFYVLYKLKNMMLKK